MLETNKLELDTIQEQGNTVIDTANDILLYRLRTTPNYPEFEEYIDELHNTIEKIKEPYPQKAGIMFESYFYIACKEYLPLDIRVSDGLEDIRGIDFFITSSTRSFPVDVTLSKEKYPKKLYNTNKFTLLLPEKDKYYNEIINGIGVDKKIFLEDIYKTNMEIMANKNSNFQINKVIGKDKKGRVISETKTLSRYKDLEKPNWENNKQKLIIISNQEYEEILSFLSILNNLNS